MIRFTIRKWRRVLMLSATFFISTFSWNCVQKKNPGIGQDQIDQDMLLNGTKTDTFSLFTL